jgi:DNA polymerase-3 subunit gamma/tau
MSYQVIARKWRPQTFEEVTGQESITRTLKNAIEHDRLHHAYLFSGARGVGKTTSARLLAKALNCHKSDKPTVTPCSFNDPTSCASCKEIAEGRSIDVMEIDAASNTGVGNVREAILENIEISPARDRFKVFIVDEVHQLSKQAFDALLKTLEEPPPRVVFIMATTELHKVPETILSRSQQFEFRTIALAKILARLKIIAEAEKINISDAALREIARAGEGSMRDAQSAFDQVISFSGEKIETEDVTVALGIASSELLLRVVRAIAEQKPAEALFVVDELISRGQDLRNFCRDLLNLFRDLLVAKIAGDTEHLLDSAMMSAEELQKQAAPFSESDLTRFFHSLSETETKLKDALQTRYVLEIGLVKLIEMRRVAGLEKILERLAGLEAAIQNGNLPPTTPTSGGSPTGNNQQNSPAANLPVANAHTSAPRSSFDSATIENSPNRVSTFVAPNPRLRRPPRRIINPPKSLILPPRKPKSLPKRLTSRAICGNSSSSGSKHKI